jgi:hypothetical protein
MLWGRGKSLAPAGNQILIPYCLACSEVALLTELLQLSVVSQEIQEILCFYEI